MITTDNITSHELIGLHTEVVKSFNPQITGLKGIIVDETKSMFRINTKRGVKSIPKNINIWKFFIDSKVAVIDGSKITKRSFDRIGVKV